PHGHHRAPGRRTTQAPQWLPAGPAAGASPHRNGGVGVIVEKAPAYDVRTSLSRPHAIGPAEDELPQRRCPVGHSRRRGRRAQRQPRQSEPLPRRRRSPGRAPAAAVDHHPLQPGPLRPVVGRPRDGPGRCTGAGPVGSARMEQDLASGPAGGTAGEPLRRDGGRGPVGSARMEQDMPTGPADGTAGETTRGDGGRSPALRRAAGGPGSGPAGQGKRRLGVMGGTFDPIHHGHLVAASEVAARFHLDEVVFVPTGQPWQKSHRTVSAAEDRYLMTVVATVENPQFSVSRIDIDRGGPTYTVDTLRDLRALNPDTDLFFITGADALAQILTWRDSEELFSL